MRGDEPSETIELVKSKNTDSIDAIICNSLGLSNEVMQGVHIYERFSSISIS